MAVLNRKKQLYDEYFNYNIKIEKYLNNYLLFFDFQDYLKLI